MKSLLIVILLVAGNCFLGSCRQADNSVRFVNASDPALCLKSDTLMRDAKLYTGIVFSLSEAGDTLMTQSYVDGLLDGVSKESYENRKPKANRLFKAGLHEGLHEGWWPNGNRKFQYSYHKGLLEDSAIEWRESGQIYRISHYVDGQESGLQTVWNADGALFANYEARDGRKYGLTGTRHCVNPWKGKS